LRLETQRAGTWFIESGIQDPTGGVARYYRADLHQNQAASTEITGYAVSTLVYLHALTGEQRYLDRAVTAARFLAGTAWNAAAQVMPFELDPPVYTYFFDCGIIVRGLLAAWRATGTQQFLDVAAALGRRLACDFASTDGDFHPILSLPGKRPAPRDALRWSQTPGCYQLKAAMAWWDLAEATGDDQFREPYERVLEYSLGTYRQFLPGHPDRLRVMDRLHAFSYFLEGLLPVSGDPRCAAAIREGLQLTAQHLENIAPEFARSDVYAQLLRMRLYADAAGVTPLDREAAAAEAAELAGFQITGGDPRSDGGFYFGRRQGVWINHVNPVSTGFGLQALAMWQGANSGSAPPLRHMLI
jgi:hypothetical protein